MGRTHAVVAALIVGSGVVAVVATTVAADPALDRARTAFGTSDYMTARAALADALAGGDNDRDDLVEIYKLDATIAAGLGSNRAAVDAFERVLVLAPDTTLPKGTSPKITRPFATAQAWLKTAQPLAIKVDTESSPPALTIHVTSDPLHMIASARVIARVDGGAERTLDQPAAKDGADVSFALPVGRRIEVRAVARDDHGNRLAEVGTADVPLVIIGPELAPMPRVVAKVAPAPVAEPHRPAYFAWWLWAGASAAAAGGGLAAVVGVYDARSELQRDALAGRPEAVAKPVEDRGTRDAVLANVAFAGAGVLAIGSAILYATRHGAHGREDDRHARLAPATVHGGPAVVLDGRF